jgi:hypothetical protein
MPDIIARYFGREGYLRENMCGGESIEDRERLSVLQDSHADADTHSTRGLEWMWPES